MNWGNGAWPALGRCECGVPVYVHNFRDRVSLEEFGLSGYCQRCQDEFFLATSDDDPEANYSLRRGALAAVRAQGSALAEVCLFPFVLAAAPVPRIAWEARWLAWACSRYPPADAWEDLAPMETALANHQVRLTAFQSLEAPGLGERPGNVELLVGLDGPSLDAVSAACPVPPWVSFLSLCDGMPWIEAFGRELRPLETWSKSGKENGSALHMCALMAYVMLSRGRSGRALDLLFGSSASGVRHRSKDALDDGGAS